MGLSIDIRDKGDKKTPHVGCGDDGDGGNERLWGCAFVDERWHRVVDWFIQAEDIGA